MGGLKIFGTVPKSSSGGFWGVQKCTHFLGRFFTPSWTPLGGPKMVKKLIFWGFDTGSVCKGSKRLKSMTVLRFDTIFTLPGGVKRRSKSAPGLFFGRLFSESIFDHFFVNFGTPFWGSKIVLKI